jgi:hypothetical protein
MWKEVFKAGTHKDASGNEKLWTDEDLDSITQKYNNQLPDVRHEAPVVIGHPVNNSPAYAWVDELKRDGDTLLARFSQIDPQFEELVQNGRYKKVSIALYPDMMLRHVGFLGAIPPAVKGLKDTEFNDGNSFISFGSETNVEENLCESYANAEQTHNEFSANDEGGMENASAKENKEKTEKEKFSPYNPLIKEKEKKERKEISPSKLENFEEDTHYSVTHLKSINFQGGVMPENYTKLFQDLLGWLGSTFNEEIANQTAAELEKIKAKYLNETKQDATKQGMQANDPSQDTAVFETKEFQELQRKLETLEADNREMKFNEYFKSQTGRLVPAQKQIVKLAFEAVRNDSKGFEFSEGGNKVNLTGENLIKRLIESFPNQLEFSEIARKELYGDANDLADQNKSIDEINKMKHGG